MEFALKMEEYLMISYTCDKSKKCLTYAQKLTSYHLLSFVHNMECNKKTISEN